MQAISTRYLGPTDTKGARIVAECTAGRMIFDYYSLVDANGNFDSDKTHDIAADKLKKMLANKKGLTHWDRPTVSGCIFRTGEYAHVYVEV